MLRYWLAASNALQEFKIGKRGHCIETPLRAGGRLARCASKTRTTVIGFASDTGRLKGKLRMKIKSKIKMRSKGPLATVNQVPGFSVRTGSSKFGTRHAPVPSRV
jgi:hypothetical protein